MIDLLAAVVTIGLLALGASAIARGSARGDARARRHVNRFLAYTMLLSLIAGGLRLELWPFSRWNIFSERLEQPVHEIRLFGVDREGREHDIDRRAVEPFSSMDLYTWFDHHFASLPATRQREAGSYLLDRINRARERARAGLRVGSFDRFFGPFRAPLHLLHAPIWDDPARVPAEPFVGLRVYVERWNVFEESRGLASRTRAVIFDYTPDGQTP